MRVPGWRAGLSVIALLAACGPDSTEGWQFRVDTTRSAAGVRQTSWLRVVGREGAAADTARADPVILSFDCFPGTASNTIMTDQALRQGSVEVQLRVDAEAPRTIPGFAGTTESGGQVVLTIPQDSMLGLLSGRGRATIEYMDGAGSSKTTAEFPLAGLEEYRGRFLSACAERGDSGR